jgi:hypothetical protein
MATNENIPVQNTVRPSPPITADIWPRTPHNNGFVTFLLRKLHGLMRGAPKVRTRTKAIRDFGEEKGFTRLTVLKWNADSIDGWEVSAIAAQALGAHGVYRTPTANGFLYMAITHIRHAP